ncbi:MAG: hypothetical protein LBS20_10040, partial [Prevotella sp.]|nr:hypothetical protein [Prevotella sp.]
MDRIRWIKRLLGFDKDYSRVSPESKLKVSKVLVTLKTSGYYAMLAGNFDLKAHLQQYPPLEYGF